MMDSQDKMSPYEENLSVRKHARGCRLEYVRSYRAMVITDMAALRKAGYTVKQEKPDRARIAEALDAGLEVPGAVMGGVEYVLRGRG